MRANLENQNFTATFDYFINPCGGMIRGTTRTTVISPNYPKNYQQHTNCAWSVIYPEGQMINVSLEVFYYFFFFCKITRLLSFVHGTMRLSVLIIYLMNIVWLKRVMLIINWRGMYPIRGMFEKNNESFF